MDRESALTLLRQSHDFPGPFEFRVVVLPEAVTTVVSAMGASTVGAGAVQGVTERRSRKGNYVALRVRIHVTQPEHVLEMYALVRGLDGVVTTL